MTPDEITAYYADRWDASEAEFERRTEAKQQAFFAQKLVHDAYADFEAALDEALKASERAREARERLARVLETADLMLRMSVTDLNVLIPIPPRGRYQ